VSKKPAEFVPGTLVKTPKGRAWVNVPPPGEATRDGMVFVRLGNNTTTWFSRDDLKIAP